jgi:hypothetical protein
MADVSVDNSSPAIEIDIKDMILQVRGFQVLLDSDVAKLYGYETKYINRAAMRNKERFPKNFRFQMTSDEMAVAFESRLANSISDSGEVDLRFQNGTLNQGRGEHRKYLPYVYTEQGIGMLAGILKNPTAIAVSVSIMNAFVEMRRFILSNQNLFARVTTTEYKLLEHDKRFEQIEEAITSNEVKPQNIFFDGQIYDAYSLLVKISRKAKQSLVIIDNYLDEKVLDALTTKKSNVKVIVIGDLGKLNKSRIAVEKFNNQYPSVTIYGTNNFHDRYIIVDDLMVYHCGASLKDLGKKVFSINLITDQEIVNMLCDKIKEITRRVKNE